MQLVEIRAIQPIVGSYPCSVADADQIDTILVDDPTTGHVIKKPQPRKRFLALVPVQRRATSSEIEAFKTNGVPGNVSLLTELSASIVWIEVRPEEPTVRVPLELADSLVKRGLAEKVTA